MDKSEMNNSIVCMSLSEEDQELMWYCLANKIPWSEDLKEKMQRRVVVVKNIGSVEEREVTMPAPKEVSSEKRSDVEPKI